MSVAPRLWLVRHAAVLAPAGQCYGALDVPADPAATREAAARLHDALPHGLPTSVSPLQRCELLARTLCRHRPDFSFNTHARLAEMNFGAWEGRPWDAVPRSAFDAWLADFADARPGGDGESVRTFMARVGAAWDDWRASGRDAVWITHAGVIRAAHLLARGAGVPTRADAWPREAVELGALVVVTAGP